MSGARGLADPRPAAVVFLRAAGVPSPEADADWLACHVLRVGRGALDLAAWSDMHVNDYAALVVRRANREPLQHIIGTAPFRYLNVLVGRGVFVPRPETEALVDPVLTHLQGSDPGVVVDLCAGTGVLALSVARERPGTVVHAVERSPAAVRWLRRNATVLTPDLQVHEVSVARFVLDTPVDVVVSNPPYVPDATEVDLETGADPREAVFGGPDGLVVVRQVVDAAARLLRPGGLLVVEHDETHDLADLLAGWSQVAAHDDLAGRPRWTSAVRT